MTVAIVALGNPVKAGVVELRSELSLARSAVLYADEIVLFSPWADLARETIALRESLHAPEIWGALADNPQILRDLSPDSVRTVENLAGIVASRRTEHDHEVAELNAAAARGAVRQHSLMRRNHEDEEGTFLSRLIDGLVPLLQDPTVHAVFDRRASQVFRHLGQTDARLASPSLGQRSREAELGAGLVARLPAFPQAPLDELLDLKEDLNGPLQRYRAVVHKLEADMSQELASPEVDADIQAVWRATVAPALVELEEELTDHSFVRELGRSAAVSARDLVISGASLTVALATVGDIAVSVSAAAGAAGMASHATAKALVERAANRRSLRKSDFYYLYQMARATGQNKTTP